MDAGLNFKDHDYIRYSGNVISKEKAAKFMYESVLAQGGTVEAAKEAKDFILNFGKTEKSQFEIEKQKRHSCNKLTHIKDEVWKELLKEYDPNNLTYDNRRKLAEEFQKRGMLTENEKNQVIDELNRAEHVHDNWKPPTVIEYDKEKYPTISDYMREHVKDASPEICAALREGMLVRNKYEHFIEHMRNFEQ